MAILRRKVAFGARKEYGTISSLRAEKESDNTK